MTISRYGTERNHWKIVIELGRDPTTGKRERITRNFFGTKRQAEEEEARLITERTTGGLSRTNRETVASYLTRWMDDHVRTRVRITTFTSYGYQVNNHLIPGLGRIRLTELSPLDIEHHYAEMSRKGLSPTSVVYQHRILKKALKQAVRWRLVQQNVADAVDPPMIITPEMSVLNVEQVHQLLKAAEPFALYPLIYTAVYTGLRRAELIGLRWQDVDLDASTAAIVQTVSRLAGQGFVFLPPKTAKGRRQVALPDSVVAMLRVHRTAQLEQRLKLGPAWADQDFIFTNGTGGPIDPPNLSRHFQLIVKAAGIPHIRLHDLRHTHATLMLKQKVHPKIVSERLGHATVGITLDRYSHVVPGLQEEAARQFDAWMTPPAPVVEIDEPPVIAEPG